MSIIRTDDYYPFGITFNTSVLDEALTNKYLCNGKEKQELTDWYDYGARMYMADIGRWGVVDNLADSNWTYSPYNFVENNPLIFIDPDGLDNYYIYGDGNIYVVKNDDKSNSYTYFSNDGKTHDLGTFNKNDKGYIQLDDYSYNKDGLNIGYGNESVTYVRGDALASLLRALSDNNTSDLTVTEGSKSDGSTPPPINHI